MTRATVSVRTSPRRAGSVTDTGARAGGTKVHGAVAHSLITGASTTKTANLHQRSEDAWCSSVRVRVREPSSLRCSHRGARTSCSYRLPQTNATCTGVSVFDRSSRAWCVCVCTLRCWRGRSRRGRRCSHRCRSHTRDTCYHSELNMHTPSKRQTKRQ